MKIRALLIYETLSGESFHSINYNNPEQVDMLLYASYYVRSDEPKAYDLYRVTLQKSSIVRQRELDKVSASLQLMYQLQGQRAEEQKNCEPSDIEQPSMGELAYTLIVEGGMDAHYVMEEMEFFEIPLCLKAIEQKRRGRMEEGRLWTFYNILPHVGTKEMKKPSDMLVFPWEDEKPDLEFTDLLNQAYYGEQ